MIGRIAELRCALLLAASFLTFGATADEAAQAIGSAIRANRYEEAVRLATLALQASPNDIRILTMEGIAFTNLGKEPEALAAFNRALKLSPGYIAALEGAAQIEYKAGSVRAIPLLDRLLKLRPDEQTAHAMRAVTAWTKGDCATAVQHFAQAKAVISTQASALREYGICLSRLKHTEAAIAVFQQLAELEPGDRQAVLSVGALELTAGHYTEAIDAVQSLLGPEHPNPDALDLAAGAYEELGDTPKAVDLLRRAIVAEPGKTKLYIHFASLCLVHRSYQVGIDMINAGLTRMPDAGELYVARGVLYVQLGIFDKADADFALAERTDPKQTRSAAARALAQYQQNDFDGALATVKSQLKSRPKDEFLYYLQAEILTSRGALPGTSELREAVSAATHAVQIKPDYAVARNLLSRLYLQAGQPDRAIEQCHIVLRDNPFDPTALYRLMRALQMSGSPAAKAEIPGVLKRFTEAQALARKQEADESRYTLVEQTGAQAAAAKP